MRPTHDVVAGWAGIAALGARAGGKARALARLHGLHEAVILPGVWVGPNLDATAATRVVRSLRGSTHLIVRSSATIEDGAKNSLAGHFTTELCEATVGALRATLKSVRAQSLAAWPQLLRRRGESRAQALRRGENQLALLVQPALTAERSGVFFANSPLHPGRALVSAAPGSCHGVVDGTVATDVFVLEGERVVERRLAFKFEQVFRVDGACGQPLETPLGPSWVHRPAGPALRFVRVPRGHENAPSLTDAQLARVARVGVEVEARLGFPPDLEFSFVGESLYVLQARPITSAPPRQEVRSEGPIEIAATGRASGPLRVVWTLAEAAQVKRGEVVLVGATDPEFLPMFRRCAAVLSIEGSALTHSAIVARELGLPCLVGVDEGRDGPFVEGRVVHVDAFRGVISHASAPRAVQPKVARGPRGLTASAVIAEVEARLLDASPGAAQLALARRLVGTQRVRWDCAPVAGAADEARWRRFFERGG